ncbi:hypothetical protein ABZS66_41335 [Dactylosporangium sp. NPDC005572]|uniref:hypothetical protein n=1 Tax=Dactylosporangium sp. NPDC005572 TaxID=3156889 RepID=UPI0033B73A33
MFRLRRRPAMEWPVLDRDPAYDDLAGRDARDRAAQGDWLAARDVLAGSDWEQRGVRVQELAGVAAEDRGWLDAWLAEAPGDPAAVLVDGAAQARRGQPGAEETLRRAAALAPHDPCPWVELQRLLPDRTGVAAALREVKRRDPHSYAGQRAALRFAGSDRERFAVARLAAETAPSGAAACALPAEAHVEFARRTIRGPGAWNRRTLVALRRYFERDDVHDEIVAGTTRWRQGRGPRLIGPRHAEAAAYFFADDRERLRMVIEEIHPYLGDGEPWNPFGKDERGDVLYVVARNTALNG